MTPRQAKNLLQGNKKVVEEQAQLRAQLLAQLKHAGGGLQAYKNPQIVCSSNIRTGINHAIAEYFKLEGYSLSSSIFQSESGISDTSGNLHKADILQLMGVSEEAPIWKALEQSQFSGSSGNHFERVQNGLAELHSLYSYFCWAQMTSRPS